jgi:hypothetical protein
MPPPLDAAAARAQLKLMLQRVVYVLHLVVDSPDGLLDGRYHQTAADALEELDEQIKHANLWAKIDKVTEPNLKAHDLMGRLGALKHQASDQCFQELLDRVARLERAKAAADAAEINGFHAKVREGVGTLGNVVQPTLESAENLPIVGDAIGGVREAWGVLSGLVRHP